MKQIRDMIRYHSFVHSFKDQPVPVLHTSEDDDVATHFVTIIFLEKLFKVIKEGLSDSSEVMWISMSPDHWAYIKNVHSAYTWELYKEKEIIYDGSMGYFYDNTVYWRTDENRGVVHYNNDTGQQTYELISEEKEI